MKDILEQKYNIYYEDYKTYNEYAKKVAEKVKKDREEFNDFATKNITNSEMLIDKLFELQEKQYLHLIDLASLKGRLKIATDILSDVINIPTDILKEVSDFPNLEFYYKFHNGDFIPTDEEKVEKVKKAFTQQNKQNVKELLNNIK